MKLRALTFLICVLCLSLTALPAAAADEGRPIKGHRGPDQGNFPTVAQPKLTNANPASIPPGQDEEHEPGKPVTPQVFAQIKAQAETQLPTGGQEIHLDSTPTPLAPNTGTNFNGLGQNGVVPYDAAIAVGPNHIVVMTNSQWIVYDRNGAVVRAVTNFSSWWSTPAGSPFDPRCFYDPVGGRFVMLAVSKAASTSAAYYHISVSQTGDPTGSWNNYVIDATLNGTTHTSNWADFPGLGYDANAIYVSSNQFSFVGDIFQYAKIRVFSKAQLYAGSAATYTDFYGASLQNSDGTQAFTVQPARTLSSTNSEYFLNTIYSAGSTLTLWRIDNAPSSPSLVRQKTLTIGSYFAPPNAVQAGTTTTVETDDNRMHDIVWRSGLLHATFNESFSGLAAVRFVRVNTTNSSVVKDITYTQPGVYYYYPAVADDSAGNMYLVFNRSSATEYVSVYQTGMQPSDSAIQPSALAKAGVSSNTLTRWGDYSSIANDPADSLAVVSYAGWANTSNHWATWITGMSFAGGTATPTLLSVSPTSGGQGANVSVTLTGKNTHWLQGASVITVSGSGVTTSNVVVSGTTSLTATFNIASNAVTGTRNVSVTTGTEATTTSPFSVTTATTPAPTLTAISPSRGFIGITDTHTLAGTNFVSGMTVSVSGTLVSASNVIVSSSTQATVDLTVGLLAALGTRNVSVTTAGGTSGTLSFMVVGVPVITSITPITGNAGTTVAVTLQGSQFLGGSVNVSGTGVTVGSGGQILNNGTTFTASFIIASNAAGGPYSVTVVNGAGTSNPMLFTVIGSTPPTIITTSLPTGEVGVAFNSTLATTGGTAPYSWSITSGALPAGLTLNASTGVITGTPTSAGTSNFTATVTDAASNADSQALTIVELPAVSISTASLSNGQVGVNYSATLAATGGLIPYTWSVTTGALPAGVSLNSTTGALSGTPTASGTANFTVTVTDGLGKTANKALSIAVNPAVSVTTTSLPGGQVGVNYSSSVAVTGGTTPYSWSVTVGALPAGVSLISTTGALSGTPTAAGIANFTVTVTDGLAQTANGALSITVIPTVSVTTASLPGGQVGVVYAASLTATGGTTPYSWSVTVGAMPAGVTLNSATGALSGTPTVSGTANISVTVTDALGKTASQVLSIAVNPVVGISTTSLPSGYVGVPYAASVAATGGTTPYAWSISTGALPAGVTLAAGTGALSGTPTASGTANFTVRVTDGVGQTASKALSIATSILPAPTFTSVTPNQGAQGSVTPVTLTGTNFVAPISINISTPADLSASNVVVVNAQTITANLTVTPGAALGNRQISVTTPGGTSGTEWFKIVGLPSVTSITPNNGNAGTTVAVTLQGSQFLGGSVYVSGTGVTVGSGGQILNNGATFTANFIIASNAAGGPRNVTVANAAGTSNTVVFTINGSPPPAISTTSLPDGQVGVVYAASINAAGGTAPYSWSITSGALPAGLTFNTNTGTISGTPTAAGTFNFTVTVTDAVSKTDTQVLTIVVNPAVSISTSSLPIGYVNVPYSASVAATGGTAPYSWSVTSGLLPAGVNLNSATGALSGTPTASGTANFTVRVTDGVGQTATMALSIVTSTLSAPTFTSVTPNQGAQGSVTPVTLTGTNFVAPVTINISTPADLSASNIVVVNAQTITANLTVTPGAALGNRQISVTTAGGTSGTESFKIVGLPSITSITPNNGNAGTTVAVTLQGSQFLGGSVYVSGTGVTVGSGGQILNNGTTFTASFIIAANAVAGPRNVTVANAAGTSNAVVFTINGSPPPAISTTSLPNGQVGVSYTAAVAATGGITPYAWSVTAGALPAGVSLNSTTGALGGTPTAAGTANFTVTVTDGLGQTASKALSIAIL